MRKKGLCSACINDKECSFPRKFPVWQCEEFEGYEKKTLKNKEKKKTIAIIKIPTEKRSLKRQNQL
jgi:hypothetical protein